MERGKSELSVRVELKNEKSLFHCGTDCVVCGLLVLLPRAIVEMVGKSLQASKFVGVGKRKSTV